MNRRYSSRQRVTLDCFLTHTGEMATLFLSCKVSKTRGASSPRPMHACRATHEDPRGFVISSLNFPGRLASAGGFIGVNLIPLHPPPIQIRRPG